MKNSDEVIKEEEYNKAGELLWGALVQLLKAIGILVNSPTRTHKEVMKLAQTIYTTNKDVELRNAIKNDAQALHANFYQEFMDKDVFYEHRTSIRKAYEKLFKIILNGI